MSNYYENKALWHEIVKARGMDKCSKCGYDRCFGAIDFHHVHGNSKNQVRICLLFAMTPTTERIAELDKVIPLCATCHREHHINEGSMGKPADYAEEVSDAQQRLW